LAGVINALAYFHVSALTYVTKPDYEFIYHYHPINRL